MVLAIAAGCAWAVIRPFGDRLDPRFEVIYSLFSPAIQFAAGNGMKDFQTYEATPGLSEYLFGDGTSFDVSALKGGENTAPMVYCLRLQHYYLIYALGVTYKILGVSRWSVHLLCIFLYAINALVLYAIFRLAMGRLLSLGGTLISVSLPIYVAMSPSLRDFSKAPWILGVVLVLGILMRRPHRGRVFLALSVLLGVLAGIGVGFRQDLLICPILAVPVLGFIVRVEAQRPALWRLGGILAMVGVFAFLARPVFEGMRADGSTAAAHTLSQGLAQRNENLMHFGDASYEHHIHEGDAFNVAVIRGYTRRTGETKPAVDHTPAYGNAGRQMFMDVFRQFPADIYSRAIASIVFMTRLPEVVDISAVVYPDSEESPVAQFGRLHAPITREVSRLGLLFLVAGLFVLAVHDLRMAVGTAFLAICLMGYPSLLCCYRHCFHLAFIPYWFLGLTLVGLGKAMSNLAARLRTMRRGQAPAPLFNWRGTGRGICFTACGFILMLAVLAILLLIQQRTTHDLVERYRHAKLERLDATLESCGQDVLFSIPSAIQKGPDGHLMEHEESVSRYLVARVRGQGRPVELTLTYDEEEVGGFTQLLITPAAESVLFFFPVYETGDAISHARFQGVSVPADQQQCLEGIYRVVDSQHFRLWPFVMLPGKPGEFVWAKTGPVEKVLMMSWVELKGLIGHSKRQVLAGYLRLLHKYPIHVPFVRRALAIPDESFSPEEAIQVWENVLPAGTSFVALDRYGEAGSLASTLIDQGQRFAARGAVSAAKVAYRKAIDLAPWKSDASLLLSDLCITSDDPASAAQEWRAIVAKHPSSVVLRLSMGQTLEGIGDLDGAIAVYEEAYLLDPEIGEAKVPLASALRTKAQVLLESNELEDALNMARRSGGMAQDRTAAAFVEAEILIRQGNTAGAKQIYTAIIESAPHRYEAFDGITHIYVEAGDPESLEKLWREAIEQYPDSAPAHYSLGKVLAQRGDLDGAVASYEQAQLLDPDAGMLKGLLARATLAKAQKQLEKGDTNAALELVQRTGKITPGTATARLVEAEAFAKQGRTKKAKSVYRALVESAPRGYEAFDGLSRIYVEAGDLQGLEEEWRQAAQQHPKSMLVHFSLGLALERQDKNEEAIACYEKALSLDPEATGTKAALIRVLKSYAGILEGAGKVNEAASQRQRALAFE